MSNIDWGDIIAKLQEPFCDEELKWRVNRAKKTQYGDKVFVVPYITKNTIQQRLDKTLGPENWCNVFETWREQGVLCGLSIRDPETKEWITKYDGADETDNESTKGGFTNAFKRAASAWGLARSLSDIGEKMVDVKEKGEHYINSPIKINGQTVYITGKWDSPIINPSRSQPQPPNHRGTQQSSNHQNEDAQKQADSNEDNGNNQRNSSNITRDQILEATKSKLERIGIKNMNFIYSLFKNANPNTNVKSVGDIDLNASWEELKTYYDVIEPVSKVVNIASKKEFPKKELLDYIQIIKPERNIESFYSCFNLLTDDDVQNIKNYILDYVNKNSQPA